MSLYVNFFVSYYVFVGRSHTNMANCDFDIAVVYTQPLLEMCVKCRNAYPEPTFCFVSVSTFTKLPRHLQNCLNISSFIIVTQNIFGGDQQQWILFGLCTTSTIPILLPLNICCAIISLICLLYHHFKISFCCTCQIGRAHV